MLLLEKTVLALPRGILAPLVHLLPMRWAWGRYLKVRIRVAMQSVGIPEVQRAAKLGGRTYEARFERLMAGLRYQSGDYGDAAKLAADAAERERSPGYRVEYLAFAGLALFQARELEPALSYLRQAHDWLEATSVRRLSHRRLWHYVNYFMWASLEQIDRVQEGVSYLLVASRTERRAERGSQYLDLGLAYFQLGDAKAARQWFRKASHFRPVRAEALKWQSKC